VTLGYLRGRDERRHLLDVDTPAIKSDAIDTVLSLSAT
jgi:hypothetical protein